MITAAESLRALGLDDDEEKKKPSAVSAEASLKALGLVPEETTLAGLGKSALSAVPKGIFNFLGMPADLVSLGREGMYRGAEKLFDATPEQAAAFRQGDLPLPTSGLLRQGVEKVTGPLPLYEPQTRPEKAVDTAIQMMVGLGRPTVPSFMKVVLPATAGTETAGALTDDNPWARAAGGFLGGGAAAVANAYRNVPRNAVRQAIGDLDPAALVAAETRQAQGQRVGVPLMGPESLPNSGIQQLASDVMASRTGTPIMRDFLEQRPGQVRGTVERFRDAIAGYRTPEASAGLAQDAATNFVRQAEGARTAAVRPFYAAAQQEAANPANALAAIAAQRAQFPLAAQQRQLTNWENALRSPNLSASALDNLYRDVRDSSTLAQIGASSADKSRAAVARSILPALETASAQSPNISAGRNLYSQITRDTIDPLQAGPVGRIAGVRAGGYDPASMPPVQRVLGELSDTATVRPETIREAHTALNATDRQAFPAIARTYIENTFDQATKRVQSGENVKLGANWANAIRGTDQQRANFDEILRGVADAHGVPPDQLVRGTHVLFETLEATGKIPGIGSQTAQRLATQGELARNPISAASDIVSTKPLGMAARWAEKLYGDRRNATLAEWFTAPNSVEIIARMAKLRPDGTTARYYVGQLLNLNKELNASGQ